MSKSARISAAKNGFVVYGDEGESSIAADLNAAINIAVKELGMTLPEVVLVSKKELDDAIKELGELRESKKAQEAIAE